MRVTHRLTPRSVSDTVRDSVVAIDTNEGAIENRQLVRDQDGLGHHGTHPAGPGEPGDGRQDVKNQDNYVAHVVIVNNLAKSTKC